MNRYLVIILLLAAFPISLHSQTSDRRDGNWWNQTLANRGAKLDYVVGFFDGTVLGRTFSYMGQVDKNGGVVDECVRKAGDSFDEYEERYLRNVSHGQLADGLDVFYKGLSEPPHLG